MTGTRCSRTLLAEITRRLKEEQAARADGADLRTIDRFDDAPISRSDQDA